ncbi:MAG: RNA-binding protein [Bacteriovoracaceae bacterium]|jgi:RNA recognition motif-containing protein|nr:RNA-binding protein [Bacteriovoracaceae bacterium]
MGIKLYVGNLSYSVQSNDLSEFFEQYGSVTSAKVITDRETGRSKGFGFVEMNDASEGQEAISSANGAEFQGRNLKVTEALPQESKGGSTGGFNKGPRSPKRW